MPTSYRGVASTRVGLAIRLLVMGIAFQACQLAVDVDQYQFDDAGVHTADLEPLPTPDADLPAPPRGQADAGTEAAPEGPPDEMTDPPPLEPPPLEPEPSKPDPEPSKPAPPDPVPPPPPDPERGCSIIQYCYAYQELDTTDEERCIQLGCTLDQAIVECRAEIADICGSDPQPPFVMITLADERVILN